MQYAMEFHDSRLKAWSCDENGRGYALFDGVIYRGEGSLFLGEPYESGWQDVRFEFEGMRIEGNVDLEDDPWISDGGLIIENNDRDDVIDLLANRSGNLCMEMRINPEFDWVRIYAQAMTPSLLGEFEHEKFWPGGNS